MADSISPVVTIHQTRRGPMAHFTADICIGGSLHHYGEWAEAEIAFLWPYIAQGGTVIDVGANVGCHTLAFAEAVGPAGRVIAVEAEPSTYTLLAHNIVTNGLAGRVTALPVLAGAGPALVMSDIAPLGANAGAKSFFVDVHGADVHGTPSAQMPLRAKGLPVRLAMMTLDDLHLDACAVIKIDVEGMEPDVLRGARETLRRTMPVVYFEHAAGQNQAFREAAAMLRDHGYRLFLHVADPFNPDNFKRNGENLFGGAVERNVAAIPPGAAMPSGLEEVI